MVGALLFPWGVDFPRLDNFHVRMRTLLAAFFVLAATPVFAAQCGGRGPELKEPALCSRAFTFNGSCGEPKYKYPDWDTVAFAVGAWEKVPIRIVAAAADALVSSRGHTVFAKIFVGNSHNADPMTPEIGNGAGASTGEAAVIVPVHSEEHFPWDAGMQFPAGLSMEDAHLDVHIYCLPKGAGYSGSLTVWYRLDP